MKATLYGEFETLWLPWSTFLEHHVQRKERDLQFWSYSGDHSEIHLRGSPLSSTSSDTASGILEGLHEKKAKNSSVPLECLDQMLSSTITGRMVW